MLNERPKVGEIIKIKLLNQGNVRVKVVADDPCPALVRVRIIDNGGDLGNVLIPWEIKDWEEDKQKTE